MKLLVDMNLSPSWVDRLARHGFEAVHWSTIGAATAPDVEILAWANEHEFVVITNDLDFSAILAASAGASPSVMQIRTQDLLSDAAVSIVANAIEAHREDIERGALLSIDEAGTRVRMLPLRGSPPPLHRSQAHGGAHLSSLSGHESRAHQLVPASITRLDRSRSSASTQRHLTIATEHERALTRRELALRAVAAVGADRHLPELPTTEAPRAGSSSGEPALPCRGRLARRGHHLAPRPALGCATGAATNRADGR